MAKHKQVYRCLIAVFGIIVSGVLYACHAPTEPAGSSVIDMTEDSRPPVSPLPIPLLPTPQISPPITTCVMGELYQITRARVNWVQWSADASQLFYRLQDENEYWAFDLEYCAATAFPPQQLPQEILDDFRQATFRFPENIRDFQWSIAPSGMRAVFFQREVPSVPPVVGPGEGDGGGFVELQNDIFFLEKDEVEPLYLGSTTGYIGEFIWLPDERNVLIRMERIPGEAYLWIANIETQTLTAVLPVREDFSDFEFKALSPDGEKFLYRREAGLFLYDLRENAEQQISLEVSGRDYYWFLSQSKVLIIDDFDQPLDFLVATYDLDTGALRRIYETPLRIHSVDLSPNNQYLAIRWDQTLDLFLLPIFVNREPCD